MEHLVDVLQMFEEDRTEAIVMIGEIGVPRTPQQNDKRVISKPVVAKYRLAKLHLL